MQNKDVKASVKETEVKVLAQCGNQSGKEAGKPRHREAT